MRELMLDVLASRGGHRQRHPGCDGHLLRGRFHGADLAVHVPGIAWREDNAYRLRAVGPLFKAEDEAQEWPEMNAAAIRDARTHYQAREQMPDWQELEDRVTSTRRRRTDVPETAPNPSGKE